MTDKNAQQNALRVQRAYEAYEREWRRKEKDAAEKHASQEKELREERIKQQEAREYAIAVEAHKMRQEFYENLARQKALEEKLKKEEIEAAERNKKYALEVKVLKVSINSRPKSVKKRLFVAVNVRISLQKEFIWPKNDWNKRKRLIVLRKGKFKSFVDWEFQINMSRKLRDKLIQNQRILSV